VRKEMAAAVILAGLPGSGKTTYYAPGVNG
jgi:signal recognition particle GTPase